MNLEVGSIMKAFYNILPAKIYDLEVPNTVEKPSMYFPAPLSFDENDTVSTYRKVYTLNVKLFHENSQKAYSESEKIADTIRSKRHTIPLLDLSGNHTGDFIRIRRIETRRGEMGVAIIAVTWDSRYLYEREDVPSLNDITIGVK